MAALDMVKNKLRTLSDQLAKITDERDDFKLKFDAEKNAKETVRRYIITILKLYLFLIPVYP